ncbi:MAG: hypothetical protein KGR47_13905, partial [Acidobacteria bacterium]|nr:hypothetical protein [Acidobacteriota bacterium]
GADNTRRADSVGATKHTSRTAGQGGEVAAIDQPQPVVPCAAPSAATVAPARNDVVVRSVHGAGEVRAVSELLARVWGTTADTSPAPRNVLSAIVDTDGYVAGAWIDGELVGASFGVTYLDVDGPALRSQVTGTVRPRHGIGEALKRHQWAWAAERGMRHITWTFDPLVRSNAHFNLDRLGARIVRFVPDFYGSLDDGLNGADETDRCVVSWDVTGGPPAPVDGGRCHGSQPGVAPSAAALLADGVHRVVLAIDDHGGPVVFDEPATALLVATPADIVALRRARPDLAVRWRHAIREAFTAAFAAGSVADLITSDGFYRFGGSTG